jgi:hypothetical protein
MAVPNTQVVFLSDAKSVVEGIHILPHLLYALQYLRCNKMVLQWNPSHYGIQCNEKADKLAKQGAEKPQTDNSVSLPEINTMIKKIHIQNTLLIRHLSPAVQAGATNNILPANRLQQTICTNEQTLPARFICCSCGEDDQTAQHLLQVCRLQDAKDDTLAYTTEHPGTTVWPSGDASDYSTVHYRPYWAPLFFKI